MRAVIKGAIATALIVGTSLAGTAPAQARDHTGAAIVAGIVGLGIGAAIASDNHRSDYYGYDNGPSYYAQPAYYGGGYSYPSYSYGVSYYDNGRGYRDDRRGYDDHRGDRGGYDRHDNDRGDHDRGGWDHRR